MLKYLSREESSQYCSDRGLQVAPSTLAKMATTGGGPRYYRFGRRAVYDPADLEAWITEKLGDPRGSTSEAA